MTAVFLSVLFFAVFQLSTCAMKMPPSFLEPDQLQGMPCFHQNNLYKPWERFVNQDCTGYCTCNGRSGSVGCVSLCPPSPVPFCAQGEAPEIRNVPALVDKTGRCSCKRKSCNPRPRLNFPPPLPPQEKHPLPPLEQHVLPQCRNRLPNEWFINSSCSGRCRCRFGGIACVSLCPPELVMCSLDAEKESYQQPMDDEGRCFCKRERCVEKVGV